ncbi:hypothetical protein [Paenibacillus sp. 481]|uniref:hypothetical protein n=1 Tax=Paenibacillus sp. 481 TaxID=2835869 RepID=UPI001E59E4B4|nr:hypothetical protein [Paenibacillus sp. 481]UHA74810.1 hypothetical protein KIK04_07050 [Paenibacillus sp. 481]
MKKTLIATVSMALFVSATPVFAQESKPQAQSQSAQVSAQSESRSFSRSLVGNDLDVVTFRATGDTVTLIVNYQYSSNKTNIQYRLYSLDSNGNQLSRIGDVHRLERDISTGDPAAAYTWKDSRIIKGERYQIEIDNDSKNSSGKIVDAEVRGLVYY